MAIAFSHCVMGYHLAQTCVIKTPHDVSFSFFFLAQYPRDMLTFCSPVLGSFKLGQFLSLSLFHVLTVLKKTALIFCRMVFFHWVYVKIPHDQVQIMHFWQENQKNDVLSVVQNIH